VVSSLLLLGQATVQQAYKKTAYSYNQWIISKLLILL
jgi:hypothetical protein